MIQLIVETCVTVTVFALGLFWRIHQMDLYQSAIVFVLGTIISTYLVAMSYKNVKFILKHKSVCVCYSVCVCVCVCVCACMFVCVCVLSLIHISEPTRRA